MEIYGAGRSKDGPVGDGSSVCSLTICSQFSLIGGRMERLRRAEVQVQKEVDLREQKGRQ